MSRVKNQYPSQAELRELFDYEEGHLIRKTSTGNRARAGQRIGSDTPHGYRIARVCGKLLQVHRLIFIWHFGEIENGLVIDHIDGNGLNNRIENLQAITQGHNINKRRMMKNNTSGFIGVTWSKQNKKYLATIYYKKGHVHLGCFDDPKEAATAYDQAATTLYGKFANTNFDIKNYAAD